MINGDILPIEVMVRRDEWNTGVSIYIHQRTVGEGYVVAAKATMIPHESGTMIEPMMRLEIQEAQQLMDELWRCGLRPTEGTGSAGSLAATERHLKDMQTVAFGVLRKSGVQI
jgi:hypothetical protein